MDARKTRKTFLLLGLAFVVLAWLFLFRFNTLTSPYQNDEGEYAYAAQILHGGGVPYKEDFMQKPPMIIYTYYLAESISPSVAIPRIFVLIFLLLSTLIVMDILRQEYGTRVSIVFLLLFSPLISFFPFESMSAQPEVFLLLPFVASWWCYFRWLKNRKIFWLFALGVFSALAILYKQIIAPACGFEILCILLVQQKNRIQIKEVAHRFLFIFIGLVVTTLLVLLPIFIRGGLLEMWQYAFVYNVYYAPFIGLGFRTASSFLPYIWAFILLCGWFLIRRLRNWLFFAGVFVMCIVGTFGSELPHYYIIVLPVMAAIAAIALVDLPNNMPSLASLRRKNIFIFGSVLCIIAILYIPFWKNFLMTPQQMTRSAYAAFPFDESMLMAQVLQENTKSTDQVFIYGSEPQILYYAQRKSITQFVILFPLTVIKTPLLDPYVQILISELASSHPKAIVTEGVPPDAKILQHPGGLTSLYAFIIQYLFTYYEPIGGTIVNADGDASFIYTDSLNTLRIKGATLVLFLRRN